MRRTRPWQWLRRISCSSPSPCPRCSIHAADRLSANLPHRLWGAVEGVRRGDEPAFVIESRFRGVQTTDPMPRPSKLVVSRSIVTKFGAPARAAACAADLLRLRARRRRLPRLPRGRENRHGRRGAARTPAALPGRRGDSPAGAFEPGAHGRRAQVLLPLPGVDRRDLGPSERGRRRCLQTREQTRAFDGCDLQTRRAGCVGQRTRQVSRKKILIRLFADELRAALRSLRDGRPS